MSAVLRGRASHPVFTALRQRREELIALLQELVRCHPLYASPGQREAQAVLGRELKSLGFEVEAHSIDKRRLAASAHYVDVAAFGGEFTRYGEIAAENLVAARRFSSRGPRIVLNGHVDVEFVTAPDGWERPGLWREGARVDGRVYGRGTSDMLGGLACYVHTLKCLAPCFAEEARGSLAVQCVVDEELGGNGTLWELLEGRKAPPDFAIIAEPTELTVCGRTRGFAQLKVVCRGNPVHMVFADEFDNAHRTVADVIHTLEALDRSIAARAGGLRAGRYVMYGVIEGGTDAALPAERVEIRVTLALPPELSAGAVAAELAEHLRALERPGRLAPTVEFYGVSFPGSRLSAPHVCEAIEHQGRSRGITVRQGDFPSACDARLFEAHGIPSLVFGPGSLRRAHGSNEYVSIAELEEYCDVLAGTLLQLWSEGERA